MELSSHVESPKSEPPSSLIKQDARALSSPSFALTQAAPPAVSKTRYERDEYQPNRHRQALDSVRYGTKLPPTTASEDEVRDERVIVEQAQRMLSPEERRQFIQTEINPILAQRAAERDFGVLAGKQLTSSSSLQTQNEPLSDSTSVAKKPTTFGAIDWSKAHWGKVPALENLKQLSPLTRFDIIAPTTPVHSGKNSTVTYVPSTSQGQALSIYGVRDNDIAPAAHVRVRMEKDLSCVEKVRDMVVSEGAIVLSSPSSSGGPSIHSQKTNISLSKTLLAMPELLALGQSPHTFNDVTKDRWLREACHHVAKSNVSYSKETEVAALRLPHPPPIASQPHLTEKNSSQEVPRRDFAILSQEGNSSQRWLSRKERECIKQIEEQKQQLINAVIARASAGSTSTLVPDLSSVTRLPFYPSSALAGVVYSPLVPSPSDDLKGVCEPSSTFPSHFPLAHGTTTPISSAFVSARGALDAIESSTPTTLSVYQRGFYDSDMAAYGRGLGGGKQLWSSVGISLPTLPSVHDKGGLTWMQRELKNNSEAFGNMSELNSRARIALLGDDAEAIEDERIAEEHWASIEARLSARMKKKL